jgi:heterodisulfide reductase subunit D
MLTSPSREEYVRKTMDRLQSDVLDICTTCGECAKACPMVEPAGIMDTSPSTLVEGVLAILAGEESFAEAASWVDACSSSGSCRSACTYGVDPMFMMQMAKLAVVGQREGVKQVQANATLSFQKMAKSVRYLSRLFLKPEVLKRLAPAREAPERNSAPEIVFYTGCNVLRTPHIALICLDILDALGIDYEVMGGPSHCCGAYQVDAGDLGAATGMAMNTIGKMAKVAAGEVISWCPSCQLQFGGTHLPTFANLHGGMPFHFNPFYLFLQRHIDALIPHIKYPVHKRVALDERAFDPQVNAAVKAILRLIPGLDLVELDVKHVGMMRNMIALPHVKKDSRDDAFAAATAAGVTTLATVYHACHREVVSYSDTVSFEIVNAIELIADSLGISHHDSYKEFQLVTDIDKYIDEKMDNIRSYGLSLDELRSVAFSELAAHRTAK